MDTDRHGPESSAFWSDFFPRNQITFVLFKPFSDIPLPPTITNIKTGTVDCDVNVIWIKHVDNGCPLTMYSVYYREIQSHETTGALLQEVRIHDNLMNHHVLRLKCDTKYMIEMSAWNKLGQSNRSRRWIIKTISGKFPRSKYLDPFEFFLYERVEGREDALYSNSRLEVNSAYKMALLQIVCMSSSFMFTNALDTVRYVRVVLSQLCEFNGSE